MWVGLAGGGKYFLYIKVPCFIDFDSNTMVNPLATRARPGGFGPEHTGGGGGACFSESTAQVAQIHWLS